MRKKIINNTYLINAWINNKKALLKKYYSEVPDSLIPCFDKELRELGFEYEIGSQPIGFMPRYKKEILPIAIRYYQLAKEQRKFNEQNYFMRFLGFKGFEEVVPMLIEDYYSNATQDLTRWFISDCIYQIKSKKYIKDYIDIASNSDFGVNRQMIILLLGKLKAEDSIPILINLLEDEQVRLQAISALGMFKREEFRCYFERFENSTQTGWRKYARIALKKLNN